MKLGCMRLSTGSSTVSLSEGMMRFWHFHDYALRLLGEFESVLFFFGKFPATNAT